MNGSWFSSLSEDKNKTAFHASYFVIIGFSGLQDFLSQNILFFVFLVVYIITVAENLMFIAVIRLDRTLHSPMYIFICHLAIVDLLIPSVTVPEMLYYLISDNKTIYFGACLLQMAFYLAANIIEGFTIALMAYDRYQAICNPLHYHTKMSSSHAFKMLFIAWTPGIVSAILHIFLVHTATFCGLNKIQSYFCDYINIMELACDDVSFQINISRYQSLLFLAVLISGIVFSYIKIIMSVFKVTSSEGRWKTLSTCMSHLFVIALHLLLMAFVLISYGTPGVPAGFVMLLSLLQNVVPSLANPVIYCLRTAEIQASCMKILNVVRTTNKHFL
ncbi:putative gustatory receptor clone PTE03 [Protopterus annectens]|uniref:putative gustatory receptor clone PTE03 n=1 Tax=Protopterus annectens TaxID=7888 RepID=UPI001CF9B8DD|nr:putative gustatory receptor clone PTE03 [Protopterus annectens]